MPADSYQTSSLPACACTALCSPASLQCCVTLRDRSQGCGELLGVKKSKHSIPPLVLKVHLFLTATNIDFPFPSSIS